jgi:hypothetical protein
MGRAKRIGAKIESKSRKKEEGGSGKALLYRHIYERQYNLVCQLKHTQTTTKKTIERNILLPISNRKK